MNKNITDIDYSWNNMPEHILLAQDNQNTIDYLYDATGTKLRKFTSSDQASGLTTDYTGPFVYENNDLAFIRTSEGRIVPDNDEYAYEYFLKDHLSNTRVVFNDEGEILQSNSYYPFGGTMEGLKFTAGLDPENKYLYNGKELQDDFELDWYDYGARFYDAQLGRWHVVDNKAEKYNLITPYAYAANNPVVFIDPDGNEIILAITNTAPEHAEALRKFINTKEGKQFLAKFASANQEIFGHRFENTGVYASEGHDLMIRTSTRKELGNRKGRAVTYLKNGTKGWTRLRNVREEHLPDANTKFESIIDLQDGLTIQESTYYLGHEAFVHVDDDGKQLQKINSEKSTYESFGEFTSALNDIDIDAVSEHQSLKKDLIKSLINYVKELDVKEGESHYEVLYQEDKDKH